MANHWFKKTPSDTVLPAPEHLEYVDDGAAAVLLCNAAGLKKLNGAALTLPSAPSVVTRAIGRGTTVPIRIL